MRHTCYIGLGANLQQPEAQLLTALRCLAAHPKLRLLNVSSTYTSSAVGPGEQPDYVNAVAALSTDLGAEQLLDELQATESQQGRVRTIRWGARTLDLDILLFDHESIDTTRLQIPHPRLHERDFVLIPLLEIAPNIYLPNKTKARNYLAELNHNNLAVLTDRVSVLHQIKEQSPPATD